MKADGWGRQPAAPEVGRQGTVGAGATARPSGLRNRRPRWRPGQRHGVEAHAHDQIGDPAKMEPSSSAWAPQGMSPCTGRRCPAWRRRGAGDPVMVRQIPGHLARDHDGHGVVGGAQVGEAHHAGDAELGRLSFFAIVVAGEAGNQGGDALTYPCEPPAFHQGTRPPMSMESRKISCMLVKPDRCPC